MAIKRHRQGDKDVVSATVGVHSFATMIITCFNFVLTNGKIVLLLIDPVYMRPGQSQSGKILSRS